MLRPSGGVASPGARGRIENWCGRLPLPSPVATASPERVGVVPARSHDFCAGPDPVVVREGARTSVSSNRRGALRRCSPTPRVVARGRDPTWRSVNETSTQGTLPLPFPIPTGSSPFSYDVHVKAGTEDIARAKAVRRLISTPLVSGALNRTRLDSVSNLDRPLNHRKLRACLSGREPPVPLPLKESRRMHE